MPTTKRNLCASCFHWTVTAESRGTCALTVTDDRQPAHPNSLAHAGAVGRRAVMECAATFGCVQWQGKGEG